MSDPSMYGRQPGPRPPLRRDRQSKVVAGVCGGLGRHLGTDPVVFRILFVVFSFVGGLGLLAYAAAWLFVPQEGTDQSEAHQLLSGNNPWLAALMAVGLGLGVIAAVAALSNGLSGAWPMWLIAAAVLGVLVWRGDVKLGRSIGSGPSRPPTWWQQPVRPAPNEPEGRVETAAFTAQTPAAAEGIQGSEFSAGRAEPTDAVPPQYAEYSGSATASAGPEPTPDWRAAAGNAPVRERRRSYGGLVLASLLAVAGVMGVLNAAGAVSMTWLSGGALALLLLGGGMVIGGLFGKTTGLVPVGVVLAAPLILLTAVGAPLHGSIGDEVWVPSSAADVQPVYQVGVGDANLDLSKLKLTPGQVVEVSAEVGVGDLHVTVPAGVLVRVKAHNGIGQLSSDASDGGTFVDTTRWDIHEDFVIPSGSAKPTGAIVLNVNVGIGDADVEVAQS